jgi:hypothetical protein
MIISHKHKFIYFKAAKVAGTSTEILLSDLVDGADIVTPISKGDSQTHKPRNYNGFFNHSDPLYIKNEIGEDKFDSYFKFITVRNPFDRAVSCYFWQRSWHGKSFKTENKNFKDFILSKGCDLLTSFSDWIFLEKECIANDHIRYENLEEDTKRILSKWFNVDDFVYPRAKTGPRKEKKHYSEYYDDETREIVAEKYAKDIEYFGYEFGV